jgi:DNA-binding NarL/FixJ family response regulator
MVRRTSLGLTPRQELYLRGLCNGEMQKEIAAREFLSVQTIKNMLGEAYKILGVRSAVEACYVLGIWDERTAKNAADR